MASPHLLDPKRIRVPVAQVTVDCGAYLDGRRLPGKYTHAVVRAKVCDLQRADGRAFVWIGLHEPDKRQIQSIADVFGFHPLVVRGAVETHHRPRPERFDDTLVLTACATSGISSIPAR